MLRGGGEFYHRLPRKSTLCACNASPEDQWPPSHGPLKTLPLCARAFPAISTPLHLRPWLSSRRICHANSAPLVLS